MTTEHTYKTTLTYAVSEDLEADFHTADMEITYLVGWGDTSPHITMVEIDGEWIKAGFLIRSLENDPFLVRELMDYAGR